MLLLAALWGRVVPVHWADAAPQFGAFALMALRTGIGAAVLLPFVRAGGGSLELRANAGRIAWIACSIPALPFVMFGYAMQHLDAGFASILNATTPFWGAIVAYLWLGERLGRWARRPDGGIRRGAGAVGGRDGLVADGAIVPILASLVATRLVRRGSDGHEEAAWPREHAGRRGPGSQMFATLLLLPFALAWWPSTAARCARWLSVVLMGVLCTGLAYLLFFRLIARIGTTGRSRHLPDPGVSDACGVVVPRRDEFSASMLAGAATNSGGHAPHHPACSLLAAARPWRPPRPRACGGANSPPGPDRAAEARATGYARLPLPPYAATAARRCARRTGAWCRPAAQARCARPAEGVAFAEGRGQAAAGKARQHLRIGAGGLDDSDLAGDALVVERQVLGPDAGASPMAPRSPAAAAGRRARHLRVDAGAIGPMRPSRRFIAGEPMKGRDEGVGRMVVEFERRAHLFDHSVCMTTIRSAIVIASIWSGVT